MSKKLLQLLTTSLFMAVTFWEVPCHATCACSCYDANLVYIGTFSENDSDNGCYQRCLTVPGAYYYCCDWGYWPDTCPTDAEKKKGQPLSSKLHPIHPGKDGKSDASKDRPIDSKKADVPRK